MVVVLSKREGSVVLVGKRDSYVDERHSLFCLATPPSPLLITAEPSAFGCAKIFLRPRFETAITIDC